MYYVYENWQAGPHKTVIHAGFCSFCNAGRGRAGGYDPHHAKWHGPYRTIEDARDAARAVTGAIFKSEHRCVEASGKTVRRKRDSLNAESLGAIRRELFHMLDRAEGRVNRDVTPMKRVIMLRDEKKIPRNIANLVQTILGFRNIAEYDDYAPTEKETELITAALEVVREWDQAKRKP